MTARLAFTSKLVEDGEEGDRVRLDEPEVAGNHDGPKELVEADSGEALADGVPVRVIGQDAQPVLASKLLQQVDDVVRRLDDLHEDPEARVQNVRELFGRRLHAVQLAHEAGGDFHHVVFLVFRRVAGVGRQPVAVADFPEFREVRLAEVPVERARESCSQYMICVLPNSMSVLP